MANKEQLHLGERMKTVEAGVAEVIEDDSYHHKDGVPYWQNVERSSPKVFGFHVEVEIALKTKLESILTTSQMGLTCCLDLWW